MKFKIQLKKQRFKAENAKKSAKTHLKSVHYFKISVLYTEMSANNGKKSTATVMGARNSKDQISRLKYRFSQFKSQLALRKAIFYI